MTDRHRGAIEVAGTRLLFADSGGAGPAVLLLHGAGLSGQMWDVQADALAAHGFRVVVPDLRGHGASRPSSVRVGRLQWVEDAEALIEQTGLDRPVLAGLSLGGNLAQDLIRRHPGRYAGLAVLGATWNTGPLRPTERWALRLAAPALRMVSERRLPALLARASARTAHGRSEAEEAFRQLTRRDFVEIWSAVTEFVDPDPAYRTGVPLLLVRGEQDRTGNVAAALAAWGRAESTTPVILPGAGHLVTADAPDQTSRLLVDFAEAVASGRGS